MGSGVQNSIRLTVAGVVAVAASLVAVPPANAAKLEIGVAPSANGYVMEGEPTQIAIAGKKRGKVFLRRDGKWRLLGTARVNRPLSYTFTDGGLQRLRVKPRKGKARTFLVPVYQQTDGSVPVGFDGVVFKNRERGYHNAGNGRTRTLSEEQGCVLLDVGGRNVTIEVLSTGEPPWQGASAADGEVAQLGIPISGDTVITWKPVEGNYVLGGFTGTCLNP